MIKLIRGFIVIIASPINTFYFNWYAVMQPLQIGNPHNYVAITKFSFMYTKLYPPQQGKLCQMHSLHIR